MIETIKEYLPDILAVYGALVAISTVIVKYTPTKKDDEILSKIIKFLDSNLKTLFYDEQRISLARFSAAKRCRLRQSTIPRGAHPKPTYWLFGRVFCSIGSIAFAL